MKFITVLGYFAEDTPEIITINLESIKYVRHETGLDDIPCDWIYLEGEEVPITVYDPQSRDTLKKAVGACKAFDAGIEARLTKEWEEWQEIKNQPPARDSE